MRTASLKEERSGNTAEARLYPAFWRWHFLAALIVIPFVLWQSTTGTLYLWSEWWMDVRHPEMRFVPQGSTQAQPSAQIAAALATLPAQTASTLQLHSHATSPPGQEELAARQQTGAAGRGPPVLDLLLSDDPKRSTILLVQSDSGLPLPIFVDSHDARVLGTLTAAEWLPGITRALHGGWPLGKPGSWLLELGDGWAIVMILTGWYLWWPRGRGLLAALWPRWQSGTRILFRDLHASVAVLFSGVLLFFLISALPWTAFWGGEILSRVQSATGQESPAGFSIGGASAAQILSASGSIDQIVATARADGVTGTLSVKLSPWPDAPLFVSNRSFSLADDRIVLGDAASGQLNGDFHHDDLPLVPRWVATGIHVHQGDFGAVNLWLNTALALSLIWLVITGATSWWVRRPKGRTGVPPKRSVPWSMPLVSTIVALCVLLPIFGGSVLVVAAIGKLASVRAQSALREVA
jgi:uncharacterized iron-regulated membrane protein